MKLNDFYFELPKELIAQTALTDRASSRLMILNKATGEISHKFFTDITMFLAEGDCLVINETKVIPARLFGKRRDSSADSAEVEILLLKRIDENRWETLARPGRKVREGTEIVFGNTLNAVVEEITSDGNRILRFEYDGIWEELLDRLGEMPLPPYITEKLTDKNRYQTVYAKNEGSVAAPTAGLHFTEELLSRIEQHGVSIAKITLHVGLGTFRPVKADNITEHKMHSEYFEINESAADIINRTRRNGGSVVAVGTTSLRTLESVADDDGFVRPCSGNTDIFIYPGYRFKASDKLITNFHLPESTLIMLVCAMCGRDSVMRAYEEAVRQKYRFFSFGDAMLIL